MKLYASKTYPNDMYVINQLLDFESFRRLDDLDKARELIEKLLGAREAKDPAELDIDITETTIE